MAPYYPYLLIAVKLLFAAVVLILLRALVCDRWKAVRATRERILNTSDFSTQELLGTAHNAQQRRHREWPILPTAAQNMLTEAGKEDGFFYPYDFLPSAFQMFLCFWRPFHEQLLDIAGLYVYHMTLGFTPLLTRMPLWKLMANDIMAKKEQEEKDKAQAEAEAEADNTTAAK
jgi:hypothetical protein